MKTQLNIYTASQKKCHYISDDNLNVKCPIAIISTTHITKSTGN